MARLRVAVVGVGYLGKFHAEKLAHMEGAELVGVVDINRARADEVASLYGTKPFYDHTEMVSLVDAAAIAVPTSSHFEVAKNFLEAGVHLMVEKPITTTIEEAQSLINLAAKNNLVLQVGHVERFNPAYLSAIEHLTLPLFIEAHRLAVFQERALDVDVVLDLMIHDIDIALSMVKSPVKEIRAAGVPVLSRRTDIANVRIEFENGCQANLTASRISLSAMRRFRVFQPDSYLTLDFSKKSSAIFRKIGEAGEGELPRITFEEFGGIERDTLRDELNSFVEAVGSGTVPLVTGEDGLRALDVALRVNEQIEANIARSDELLRGG